MKGCDTLDGVMPARLERASSVMTRPIRQSGTAPMALYTIDPLTDRRWEELVAVHPSASVFHQVGWLRALAATYGYKPIVLTDASPSDELRRAIPFCKVESWMTGTRLVSMPFADHCAPLLQENERSSFVDWLCTECDLHGWKYVELRPLQWAAGSISPFVASSLYWFHTLDLTSSIQDIFRRLDKDSIQRRIKRAEREKLAYEQGRSEHLLDDFYRLLLKTRRRHQSLPQPRAWFRNLAENLGQSLVVRVARKNGTPVAALLTLRFRDTVVYKYGCSDERYHHLAGIPWLFWKLIEESKAEGAKLLDFGRTDFEHDSLRRFKDQFGTTSQQIAYLRYPSRAARPNHITNHSKLRRVCSFMPDVLLTAAGTLAYRHMG